MNTVLFPIPIAIEPCEDVYKTWQPDRIPTDSVEVVDGYEVHKMVYRQEARPPLPFGGLAAEDCTLQAQIDAGVDVKQQPVRAIAPDVFDATRAAMKQCSSLLSQEVEGKF